MTSMASPGVGVVASPSVGVVAFARRRNVAPHAPRPRPAGLPGAVTWGTGRPFRRGPPRERPPHRAVAAAAHDGGDGHTRRSTATTRPMMVAVSPGIGSNDGFAGISHTWPSRWR